MNIKQTAHDMIEAHGGSIESAKDGAWTTASELWAGGEHAAAEDWRAVVQAIEATAA